MIVGKKLKTVKNYSELMGWSTQWTYVLIQRKEIDIEAIDGKTFVVINEKSLK